MSYHRMKYHTSHIMSYHFIVIISTVIIIMIIIIIVTMVSYRVILYHIIMHTDGDVRHRIFTLDSVSCRLTKISQVPWWRHLAAGRTHSVAEEVPNPGCQTNIYIYNFFWDVSKTKRSTMVQDQVFGWFHFVHYKIYKNITKVCQHPWWDPRTFFSRRTSASKWE